MERDSGKKQRPELSRELKGLVLLYVAFALICVIVAASCSGHSPR